MNGLHLYKKPGITMRDIDGIDEAMRLLEPQWVELAKEFDRRNQGFKDLMAGDHAILGKVLQCHLVVEHYLDEFLAHHLALDDIQESRLSFFQKATLLPAKGAAVAFVRPAILRLNTIRNGFGHRLDARIAPADLAPLIEVLRLARPRVIFDAPVDAIEAFTAVACAWLMVTNDELTKVMNEAFAKMRLPAE